MGTIVEITVKEDNPAAIEDAFKEIERLENIFSSYKETSEVSKISANAGIKGESVSQEVVQVLGVAIKISGLTKGAFDPTIGVLFKTGGGVWDFSGEGGYVPDKGEIKKLIPLVNYKDIFLDKESSIAALKKKGMRLDLGGVAKGYIVGRAIDTLKKHGAGWAIIRAGGDMTVFSKNASEQFTIGVAHPREKEKLLGKLRVLSGAVATSGDYERFFIKDDIRYHHILDPGTGFPADKAISVTIVSKDPALADALSTAVFVMGPEKGMELIERLEGVEGIIVDKEGGVAVSSGLKDNFEML